MDKVELEYRRKKKKVSVDELCEAIGISRSAYYRKCKGVTEFTLSEIQGIIDYLELETPMGIFFKNKVS